ncbi:hypothetical protein F511_47137 [Dorcoceras hygrometricum]|uniref:Uncharacterized protein n=1 Tax=Dorcoceras hygrometricum TaxID=472368 RepID=A0A2Z6ZRQ7_9LAMI|nr:hypothetical protein F511_47137 [Dorcoceras hygrometricum]
MGRKQFSGEERRRRTAAAAAAAFEERKGGGAWCLGLGLMLKCDMISSKSILNRLGDGFGSGPTGPGPTDEHSVHPHHRDFIVTPIADQIGRIDSVSKT